MKIAKDKIAQHDQKLNTLFEEAPYGIQLLDSNGNFLDVNTAGCLMLGYEKEELLNLNIKSLIPQEDLISDPLKLEELNKGITLIFERKFIRKNGSIIDAEIIAQKLQEGNIQAIIRDITAHKQELSAHVLELLAKNASLSTILETMVLRTEQYSPGTLCSILLMDKEGKRLLHGAAPSLPDFYNEAIHGVEIGMGVGSCGTAAFTGKRVIVEDIQRHPYWESFKEIASQAGLAACWSEPILDASGKLLGTFAIYSPKPSSAKSNDIEIIEHLANLAAIVLERSYASAALKESNRRLALILDSTSDMMGIISINEKGEFIFNSANRANREFIKQLGIDEQNYFGAELKSYCTNYLGFTMEEVLELEKKCHQVIKERKKETVQSSFPDAQGNIFYIETTINPVFEEDGTINQFLYTVRDTTEARTAELALKASERKLALTLDSTADMMGLMNINEAGEFIFNTANRATKEALKLTQIDEQNYFGAELKTYCTNFLGFTKEEALGLEKKYQQVVKERKPVIVSSSSPTPQGDLVYIETTINPVFGDNGKVDQVLWVNKDVTEAKKVEEKILNNEKKLNEAQKIAKIGSWEFNLQTNELNWSKEQYRIFELEGTPADILYEAYRNKFLPDDLQKLDKLISRTIETGYGYSFEHQIICKDGSVKHLLGIGEPITDSLGKVVGIKGTCQDITHKVESQKRQLQSMILGEENERKRLAAELHDSLGQTLSLISLNLDSVLNLDEKKEKLVQQKLQASLEMVNQTIEDIRSISHGLMPPALQDFGLESELENIFNKTHLSTGIIVDFAYDSTIGRCESNVEIDIYRIAQEALHNTLKHADARKISIRLDKKGDSLIILYKDDGKGFDPEKKKKTYSGLKNIANRVYALGGTLSVQSVLQKGTTLSIKIPI